MRLFRTRRAPEDAATSEAVADDIKQLGADADRRVREAHLELAKVKDRRRVTEATALASEELLKHNSIMAAIMNGIIEPNSRARHQGS